LTESNQTSMLSAIFTLFCYAVSGSILYAYIYFSFKYLSEERYSDKFFILNIIVTFLIMTGLIFALASLGRFDNLNSASDLGNNIYWLVIDNFFGGLKVIFEYAWNGGTAPAYTVIIIVMLIIFFCFVFLGSLIPESEDKEKSELKREKDEQVKKIFSLEHELKKAKEAHKETKTDLARKCMDLSKKSLELAEFSDKNNKYTQFYNENSEKVTDSNKLLQAKDTKITELEEIIKRRDLQIQRLKKARKESK